MRTFLPLQRTARARVAKPQLFICNGRPLGSYATILSVHRSLLELQVLRRRGDSATCWNLQVNKGKYAYGASLDRLNDRISL